VDGWKPHETCGIENAYRTGPVDVPMNTVERIKLVHRAWRYRLRTEPQEVAVVRRLLRKGEVAVDVGAHRGAFTYWMARRVGPRGLVLAFEPLPELAQYLMSWAAEFEDRRVRVFECALSNREGTATLHLSGHHLGAATLEGDTDRMGPPIRVRTMTLDACLSNLPRPGPVSLIKCDVEHHELSVFQGGEAMLCSDRPVLVFESGNLVDGVKYCGPVFAYLESLGYRGYFFFGSSIVPLERFDPTRFRVPAHENENFVFVHAAVTDRIGPAVGSLGS